ncbi:MAG: MFS transporter [Streptosporangiaceae bacterium]
MAPDEGSTGLGPPAAAAAQPEAGQAREHRLGLRENWWQFSLLAVTTLLVGMTIGVERVALPPLAKDTFGIVSVLYTVSFVSVFGLTKSIMNLLSGHISDIAGRKQLMLAGWLSGVPYALLIIFAQAWWWVLLANVFLGVNQGLAWSMSVTAKVDIVGPVSRGLAIGIDESAGYIGTGVGGFAAGLLVASYGLRPAPYLLALGVIAAGTLINIGPLKETLPWARQEAARHNPGQDHPHETPGLLRLARYMSWHDRSMFAVCQAGLLNKFADSLVIGFFTLYFLRGGLSVAAVGVLVGVYTWVWGAGQVPAGALADRIGRKWPITAGTFLIAAGIAVVAAARVHGLWYAGAALMGVGMALAYPNMMTAVGDIAHPSWRGGALGVYRLWRDLGYAIGPLVFGLIDILGGLTVAFWTGAILLGASALILLLMLGETHPERRTKPPAWERHPEWVAPR